MLSFLEFLFVLIPVLLTSGFFTLFERKVMGSVQFREGPNKVIWMGFLQPISDALKLLSKSNFASEVTLDFIYFVSPLMSFLISMFCWIVFPLIWGLQSWYSGIFFIMFCFSISVYGVILSGWFSRSKYASLGCIRALSQSISYEIPLSVGLMVFMITFSMTSLDDFQSFQKMVYFFFPLFFLFFMMMIIFLAELNRSPFDLAEGESELVSGFSVELGGSMFVMVFLSEYVSLVWACLLISLMFLGGVDSLVGFKVLLFMFMMVIFRSSFPRVRFDFVMMMCWLMILPMGISFLMACLVLLFNQSQIWGVQLLIE